MARVMGNLWDWRLLLAQDCTFGHTVGVDLYILIMVRAGVQSTWNKGASTQTFRISSPKSSKEAGTWQPASRRAAFLFSAFSRAAFAMEPA